SLDAREGEFEADFAYVPVLLVAQQIAGAANVEIVRGQREPGAKRVERLQNLQALVVAFGQLLPGRRRDVGIGARLRAADAAAQLIKLSQAEHIGAVYDQRVG